MPNLSKDNVSKLNQATSKHSKRTPLFSRFGVVVLIVVMVVAFFISQLLGVYLAGKLLLPAADTLGLLDIIFLGSSNGTVLSLSLIISLALLTVFIILMIRAKGASVRRYLMIEPFSLVITIKMLGLLLLFMIGSQVLTYVLDATPSAFIDPLYESVSSVWLLVLAIVIVVPIYEEMVFRGILWTAIAEQFASSERGAVVASLVTSFIFATIHLQYGLYEISTIIVLALLFCYARIKSGSLLLPILLHSVNNGVAMLLYVLQAA